MTFYEYKELTQEQKAAVLWVEGELISEREVSGYSIALYKLFSFNVEIWFARDLDGKDILFIFSSTGEFEPYFEEINITS
ncbi:hypothetical protein [Segetibacter koreensis]|uniref:hypothetical protein n=1 Tax=Segetibacter koreensis TaxID=398037 RepID=UPI000379AD17|nr:hypothetical protein [Segetibacter koreensis]